MKRYKLVKALPTFKIGTKFHISADGNLILDSNFIVAYAKSTLEKFPNILKDWFEEIPELKRWRAEYGETYWFLSDNGSLYFKTEDNNKIDNYRYLIGNYFKTKEEAKAYKKYLLARQVLLDNAEGGKFIPGKENWSSVYDDTDHLWRSQYYYLYHQGGICFRDKKSIEKSLEEYMEQWKIVRKYEMGE